MYKILAPVIFLLFVSTKAGAQGTIHIEAEDYSSMLNVQTENTSDAGGGLNVGWIEVGDWMRYSIPAAPAGSYTASFRVATANPDVQFNIYVLPNTTTPVATVSLPGSTGGYQTWYTHTTSFNLPAGPITIQIQSVASAGWNINWFELVPPASSGTNQPPTVHAGPDQAITLPASTAQLTGTADDTDGSISAYSWIKVSGPAGGEVGSSNTASTGISGLQEGTYVYQFTATDNSNASNASQSDIVQIIVKQAANTWSMGGNTPSATDFIGTTDATPLIFKTNGQVQLKLTAGGELLARKITVTQDGWADYVFDPSYKLRPLNEVSAFIKENKHLPDVPSAKQVTAQGLNLGDNQAVLLRKIEELTLYMIQQNEELKKQSLEIKKLRKQLQAKKK